MIHCHKFQWTICDFLLFFDGVLQSTPKGKNCIPTVISNSDLRKAVDSILDQSTDGFMHTLDNTLRQSYPQLTGQEIVEASGVATDIAVTAATDADSSYGVDGETVGVAQALMELASSGEAQEHS